MNILIREGLWRFYGTYSNQLHLYLVDWVPYVSVLRRGVSSSLLVVDLVWKLWLSPQCFKAGKVLASCLSGSNWQMNRQFCNFMRSRSFRIPNCLISPLTATLGFLKKVSLISRFCKTWIEFWFAKLICPHNCAP